MKKRRCEEFIDNHNNRFTKIRRKVDEGFEEEEEQGRSPFKKLIQRRNGLRHELLRIENEICSLSPNHHHQKEEVHQQQQQQQQFQTLPKALPLCSSSRPPPSSPLIKSSANSITTNLPLSCSDKERSKRIFGALVGHLLTAKKQLQEHALSKQSERHFELERKVELKLLKGKENLKLKRLQQLKEQAIEIQFKLKTTEDELANHEIDLLRQSLKNHYVKMRNLISTKTEPTLFWLPNSHTAETKQLQEKTASKIDRKIRALSAASLKP